MAMEAGILILGCLLSFLCGAWVRSPFPLIRPGKKKKRPRRDSGRASGKKAEASREARGEVPIEEQWKNFWNYDGEEL